jgi:hypothetical protein
MTIMGRLDVWSLCAAGLVCKSWHAVQCEDLTWRPVLERMHNVFEMFNDYPWVGPPGIIAYYYYILFLALLTRVAGIYYGVGSEVWNSLTTKHKCTELTRLLWLSSSSPDFIDAMGLPFGYTDNSTDGNARERVRQLCSAVSLRQGRTSSWYSN